MGIYVESFILYIVLFFSGQAGLLSGGAGEAAEFSIQAELVKIFMYTAPSLALVWYLTLKAWKIEYWILRLGRKDLISGLITLPCLLFIGLTTTFISQYVGGTSAQAALHYPSSTAGWVILCFSLIASAYLEESFFRFYLLTRREELKLSSVGALTVSVALFSICHIYEGPWGFLNAAISASLLGFIFLRYNSLHGIAVAHSLYNIIVYAANAFLA